MLLYLSSELVLEIFEYVDETTVARCYKTCSRLREIISNDTSIQYRLELFVQNMVDCGPRSAGGMTTPARLGTLEHFKRTRTPKPNQQGVIDIRQFPITGIQFNPSAKSVEIRYFDAPAKGHLAEVPFYKLDGSRIERWSRFLGGPSRIQDSVLHFVQLPGIVRGIPLKQWSVDLDIRGIPGPWSSYCIDSTQDLLVPVPLRAPTDRIKLHLRRMTDGAEHPFASVSEVTVVLAERSHPHIAIYEQYIVVVQRPSEITMLNWKMCKVVKRWIIPSIESITFLDPRTFLCLTVNPQLQFHIYDVAQEDEGDHEGLSQPIPILILDCSPPPASRDASIFFIDFANTPSAPVVGTILHSSQSQVD
ncbi:hypothetical protein BDN72DRAFT_301250 [Pluteus cervinus]|uniref:Uncharacterized protein n=1 Tax=Pluteus cervinus TaxID=181527 RepID=A0ACD3AEA9_9AGAR|nr:hypothetical protein BDN72DRAFT_301250 [Pluteus cervinus]